MSDVIDFIDFMWPTVHNAAKLCFNPRLSNTNQYATEYKKSVPIVNLLICLFATNCTVIAYCSQILRNLILICVYIVKS